MSEGKNGEGWFMGKSVFAFLVLVAGVATYGVAAEAFQEKQDVIDLCALGVEDYPSVKKIVEGRVARGTTSKKLSQFINVGGPGGPKRLPVEKGDVTSARGAGGDIRLYVVRCDAGHGNKNLWSLLLVEHGDKTVKEASFRLYFEDREFSRRKIPLKLNNFRTAKSTKRALESVLPLGSTREAVDRVVGNIGPHTVDEYDGKIIVRFKYNKKSPEYSIGGEMLGRVVVFKFNENGLLVDIYVH